MPVPPATPARELEIDPERAVARFVQDGDDERIAEFLVRCFDDSWPRHKITCSVAEHVTWKMSSTPDARSIQTVIVHKDDPTFLIAAGIRVIWQLWIAGRTVETRQSGDAAVHPDWRLRRIRELRIAFRQEHNLQTQAVSLNWLARHPATRKEGLTRPEVANRLVDLFRPASVRNRLAVPRANAGWEHMLRTFRDSIRQRLRRRSEFRGEVIPIERFDERTDAVWERAKERFDLAVVRDQQRQNWRYADSRAGRYEIRAAVEGSEVIGYVIVAPHNEPAAILDLLVLPDRLDAVDALIGDALERVRAAAVTSGRKTPDTHCWLPSRHPYVDAVRARGFLDSGMTLSLRYNSMSLTDKEVALLADPLARVHVTNGDSDFI